MRKTINTIESILKDFKEAWYYFAVNNYMQKNYTDSEEASLRAIEIDGNYVKARLCLSVRPYRQNRPLVAKNILKVIQQKKS